MKTIFIADLHLKKDKPEITDGFLDFLFRDAITAEALYILGDLFDTWIGDDDPYPLNWKTAQAIKKLVDSNVPCYFIHGNRDFLIGNHFVKKSGITLLPEEKILNLYGYKILVMHGDTLCSHDKKYQIFRDGIRIPWIQKLFLSLPLFIRRAIASKIRNISQMTHFNTPDFFIESHKENLIRIMQKNQVQWCIYGHIHTPKVFQLTINNQPAYNIVLGSWNNTKGWMVNVTPSGINLVDFPL